MAFWYITLIPLDWHPENVVVVESLKRLNLYFCSYSAIKCKKKKKKRANIFL